MKSFAILIPSACLCFIVSLSFSAKKGQYLKHNISDKLTNQILTFDSCILTPQQLRKKHGIFFSSNEKNIEKCHSIGHYLTGDRNIPNTAVLEKMFELDDSADVFDYREILYNQSLDLITLEENEVINSYDLKNSGSKERAITITPLK